MLAEIVWIPETASTTASAVNGLTLFLLIVTGAMAVLVAFLLFYFAIKYRRRSNADRPGITHGSLALETFWTVTPLGIFMVIFVWGATVYMGAYRPPDDAIQVYGVGKQWMWKFQHPGGQREINELHVPVGQSVKMLLTSEDVIHSFFVPAFRIHMDVLPGRYTSVWFQATKPGHYHLFCSQYCGTGHSSMIGTVHVLGQTQYQHWLQENAEGGAALEGAKIFRKYKCITCHSADENARAPVLEGLVGQTVHLKDGRTVTANEDYIRRSIYYPGADIVVGYDDIMPTYRGQVTEEEVLLLIAYFRHTKRGQTPPRVERSRPPVRTPPINPKTKP